MFSKLFCGALKTCALESNHKKEDDFGIKLYKIELLKFQELVSVLTDLLSTSERSRANRYHFIKDKNRFVICRALLKVLLAKHIGLAADKIHLDVDSNKKPYLSSHPSVFFNLTHSGDYAVIAIANSPIGVDVEFINKEFNYKEILESVFNKIEIDEILSSNDSNLSFYKFWTRKEAIVKAIGKGIDDDLIEITVSDGLHSIPRMLVEGLDRIHVFSFKINEDYIGALAITENRHQFESIVFSPLPTSDELKSLIS